MRVFILLKGIRIQYPFVYFCGKSYIALCVANAVSKPLPIIGFV